MARQENRNKYQAIPISAHSTRAIPTTLRIDADILSAVNTLAEKEKTSLNAIVNRALRRYVEWEVFAEKFGLQSVPSGIIAKLFELLPEQTVRELGENYGNNLAPELVTFWFKKLDFTTLLKALDLLGMRYARLFHFEYVYDGRTYTLFIRHQKGARLSIYYEEVAKALFKKLGIKPRITLSSNQLTIVVSEEEVRSASHDQTE